jgi:hypothetical protein
MTFTVGRDQCAHQAGDAALFFLTALSAECSLALPAITQKATQLKW